jgi:O-antigen/teichoic acid export membrane protein
MTRRALLLSLLEQGLASLSMLMMTAAVVASSTPDVFGTFAFVITLVMIAASLQYGAVGTSMLVEVRPLDAEARAAAMSALGDFDFYYRLAAAGAVGAAAYAVSHDPGVSGAAALFALAYLWREFTRYALFAVGDIGRAAAMAALSFVVLAGLLAATLTQGAPPADAALLASMAANGAALGLLARSHIGKPRPPVAAVRAWRARFPHTGWIIANSIANEVQTRAHVVAVQIFRGVDQLGLVEATRVLFAPLLLISSAWQRAVQPRLAALVAEGDIPAARLLTLTGVGAVMGVAVLYSAAVLVAFDVISPRLFGDRYGDLTAYAAAWAAYAMLLLANWTLISFLNAMRAFSAVGKMTMVAAAATALLLLLLALDVPLVTALVVPIGVQAAVCAVLLVFLWRTPAAAERARGAAP